MEESKGSVPPEIQESGADRSGPPADDKRTLEEEFNLQRAKMKELFLQKEEDMRKMLTEKEQLESEVVGLRAELQQLQTLSQNQKSEIQSLQWLVNETVEASSSGSEEVRRLRSKTLELEQQLMHMKQQEENLKLEMRQARCGWVTLPRAPTIDVSIAPAIVRSLARKLGADTDAELTMKRNNNDEELLRSVLEPMEMEISALKDKLRETDAKLQQAMKNKVTTSQTAPSQSSDGKQETAAEVSSAWCCYMCANYEKQLVSEQQQTAAAREKATVLDKALKLATQELEGVVALHEETVRSWRAAREAAAAELAELRARLAAAEAGAGAARGLVRAATQRALLHVTRLTVQRETLQRKLDSLERDNAMLVGKYTKKAEDMQNEMIDLPNNMEDLQGYALQLREQLIFCELGREESLATEDQLRSQLLQQAEQFRSLEAALADTNCQLADTREELDRLQTEKEHMKELGDKLRHSNDMIEQLLEDKKRLQAETGELRVRIGALQHELDTSENVQQDFVRLSQSLQVQLERIREGSTEVRWQHEDDVDQCTNCNTPLPNKKKVHCRHCGRIFCGGCVSALAAGPRGRPARVCAVCRTLLEPSAKPYFSTEPPPHH